MSAFLRIVAVLAIVIAAGYGMSHMGVSADEAVIMRLSGFVR